MASTPIEIRATPGLSLTVELYPYGSDTIANGSGDTLVEETNRKGIYRAVVAESITGWHTCHVKLGSTVISVEDLYLLDDTNIYRAESAPQRVYGGGDAARIQSGTGAGQILSTNGKVTVGTNDDKTGYVLSSAYDPAKTAAQAGDAMNLADDAITGDKIADGAITSAKFTVSTITGVASGILEKLDQVWRSIFKKSTKNATTIKTFADDGVTQLTSQAISDDGTTQTRGNAS